MSIRNPAWKRDELILALDLYFRHNPSHIGSTHEEVKRLSDILKKLPIHNKIIDKETFRSPNAVYMKLCNFMRFDPNYHGVGLQKGGHLEKEIWDSFSGDPQYLHDVAESIRNSITVDTREVVLEDEEEKGFPEGKILFRRHRFYERNSALISRVKENALKKGCLECEVCGFDFYSTYGELGKGFIECHHTVPVSQYGKVINTKIKDIALVCSNCHRILHRKRPWMTVEELKTIVERIRTSPNTALPLRARGKSIHDVGQASES